jgi:hypothetical protein
VKRLARSVALAAEHIGKNQMRELKAEELDQVAGGKVVASGFSLDAATTETKGHKGHGKKGADSGAATVGGLAQVQSPTVGVTAA